MEKEFSKKRYAAGSVRNQYHYSRETEESRTRKAVTGKRRESGEGGGRFEESRRTDGPGYRPFVKREYRTESQRPFWRERTVRNESRQDFPAWPGSRRQEGEQRAYPGFRRRITAPREGEFQRSGRTAGEGYRYQNGRGEERYARRREEPSRDYRERRPVSGEAKGGLQQRHYGRKKLPARLQQEKENAELRLNRYISMGGVCSRRDADELIVAGRVKVNGKVVQTVGVKVHRDDRVEVDENVIFPEKKVYLVLNKPKDYVTTVEDPLERKTVMALVEGACKERIYPVGRLDRQTTGVLLFTNDGDFAKKLTHPKYDHKKIYHVFLDKPLAEDDMAAIAQGVELEDGFVRADEIEYVTPDCTEIGIEVHSGKNRIVRRIFEHLGYQIIKLDRVYFAGITKKSLPRGKWRFLTSREVNMLKVY